MQNKSFRKAQKVLKKVAKMCMMMHNAVIPSPTGPMKMMKKSDFVHSAND
jgi:hypothetical protein